MNKVLLVGNLTSDPETGITKDKNNYCNFNIAINMFNDEVVYVPIKVWNNQANACGEYLKKGNKVAVMGYLSIRKYTDKEDKVHMYTEVVAQEVEFLTPKNKDEDEAPKKSKYKK